MSFKNAIIRGPAGDELDAESRREVDQFFESLRSALAHD